MSSSEKSTLVEVDPDPSVTISAEDESEVRTSPPRPSAGSLLDKLRPPQLSSLSRKRSISTNKKGHFKPPSMKNTPKTITPAKRCKQFPGEFLIVRSGKLYCDICRHEISTLKSVIKVHVASTKHLDSKCGRAERACEAKQLLLDGNEFLTANKAKGSTLPDEVIVYRIKCLRAFLQSGIPISKIDQLRPLLEEGGERLTGRQHLSELIPAVLESERKFVKAALEGRDISIIFDGTTHVAEAFALVVRVIDGDFNAKQYLIRLMLAAKSLKAEEVAHTLLYTLATVYQVQPDNLLAAMRDRAAVNTAAIRTIQPLYRCMLDGQCFSHTLDHVGEKMETDLLDSFVSNWIQLFAHSPKSRLEWKSRTGVAVKSYCKTRWWSKYEVMDQILSLFGDVKEFLEEVVAPVGAVRRRLMNTINDLGTRAELQMQLAVTVEFCRPVVQATYNLEGDGPLSFTAYEIISGVRNFVNATPLHLPSTLAVANRLGGGNAAQRQQWMDHALQHPPAAVRYFNDRFGEGGSLHELVMAFRAARLCDPRQVHILDITVAKVDDLALFPSISAAAILELQEELPRYIAATEDLADNIDPLLWWRRNSGSLPAWSAACKKVLLLQPSSAAAERVFSLLQNSFGESQERALEDYVEASLMIQYNRKE